MAADERHNKRSETGAISNAVHKDALLSGPLLAPSNQLCETLEKLSKTDSLGKPDSGDAEVSLTCNALSGDLSMNNLEQ